MSMNAVFVQISPAELAEMENEPEEAEIYFDDEETPDHVKLDLEKAWHGLHYVITGETDPGETLLSQVVMGGTELGDDEEGFSGFGPARYFTRAEVIDLSRLLANPALEADAAARFNPEKMNELDIYPGFEADDAEWIMEAFKNLRDHFVSAATNGKAIVTCLV
jgi:hypothetical protein